MTLVGFSAVVYTAAAAGTLVDNPFTSFVGFLPGFSVEGEDASSTESAEAADDIASGGTSFLTVMSPTLQSLSGLQAKPPKSSESSNSTASSESASTQASTVFDAETEKGFRDHIAKYYAELPTYYSHMCTGLNNAYAIVNSPELGVVSIAPVAPNYIEFIDKKRNDAQTCVYNGVHISQESKWYGEYEKVWRMYENLTNLASIMREIHGMGSDMARERLAYYSNSSGKIREIAEFEQRYSSVRL